jgi:SAM-dependent methyltransferase
MTTCTTADEIRASQRALWDRFAAGWERWDDVVDSVLGPVGAAMITALAIVDDQRHLDVAAGTGEPGLTIAGLATEGHVTLTDIAPQMLGAATRRAQARHLTNVDARVCSVERLPFCGSSFDSATCRFGLMFFPDLDEAMAEVVRVVRPGGRVCAAVWAEPAANPWATIPGAAIAAEIGGSPPAPDAPGMFRCAARGTTTGVFERAGLRDVEEWDVPTALVTESPEQYWQLLTELTAPVVDALDRVDASARKRIADTVIAEAGAYTSGGVVRLPAKARCVIGTLRA